MYRKLLRLLRGNDPHGIFKNMLVLASGAAASKLIGILAIPILTRLFSPSDFGVLAIFTAFVHIAVPVMTFRYAVALPLPRNDKTAVNLLAVCLLSILLMTLVITLVVVLLGRVLFALVSAEKIQPYWWLLVLAIVGSSLYDLASQWAVRKRAFKAVAKTQVWQALLGTGIKLGSGLLSLGPAGLLFGAAFQGAAGVGSLAREFQADIRRNWDAVSLRRIRYLLRFYHEIPKYRLPSQFLLTFAAQVPMFCAASLYSTHTAGQLSLAMMSIVLPISLLGQTTGRAYYGEIARVGRHNAKLILEITRSTMRRTAIIGVAPTVALFIFGPSLFSLVFGERWLDAGIFSRYLSVFLYAQFLAAPAIQVLNVYNRNRYFLYINIVRTMFAIFPFLVSYVFELDAFKAVLFYSLGLTAYYVFVTIKVLSFIKNQAAH